MIGVRPNGTAGEQGDRGRQQIVLDRPEPVTDLIRIRDVRELERSLQDDRPGVHALVDEVHRDAEHLHAVLERLLDRPDARERGQQRGMHVDHPLREAPEERGADELHVAGEHDELDLLLA